MESTLRAATPTAGVPRQVVVMNKNVSLQQSAQGPRRQRGDSESIDSLFEVCFNYQRTHRPQFRRRVPLIGRKEPVCIGQAGCSPPISEEASMPETLSDMRANAIHPLFTRISETVEVRRMDPHTDPMGEMNQIAANFGLLSETLNQLNPLDREAVLAAFRQELRTVILACRGKALTLAARQSLHK
jgi:hypothetical protein